MVGAAVIGAVGAEIEEPVVTCGLFDDIGCVTC